MKGKGTVHWDAVPNTDGDLAGYRIYRALVSGGPYTLVVDPGLTATPTLPMYTIGDFPSDSLWYFIVTAYDTTGNESVNNVEFSSTVTREKVRIQRTQKA